MTTAQTLQALHRIQHTLLTADQGLTLLSLTKEKRCTMVDPTITAVIAQLDDATNAIAARIQKLIDQANNNGSVSAAEVVAALQPEVDKLKALGADPGEPIPAP